MESCSGIPRSSTSLMQTEERTPQNSKIELEDGSVYHTARVMREDLRRTEEPLTEAELRTKERKTLQFLSEDSEDEDVSDEPRRCHSGKAKASAKVNKIQHSLRRSGGTSKRVADPADAKVGLTQHSAAKKSNTSSMELRRRASSNMSQSTRSVRSEGSASRSESRNCQQSSRRTRSQRRDPEESSSGASSSEDEDDVHNRPKHMLKLPRFDGKKSFESFMAQFNNCAQHNRWNRAEKLAYLQNALDSEAANVLWDYGTEVTDSLTGLTKILESRFGGKAISEKHRIELRNRRRRRDETLQSLHSDIRRLAALAYPGVQPQTRDVITGDYFLDALGNPDLALKVRERRPEDLDAALRIALQLEVWEADAARSREGSRMEREGKRVREISNRKPDASYGAAPSTYYSSTYARPQVNYGVNSGFYRPPNSTMGCFKCGDPSHQIRECPGYTAEQRQAVLQQQQPSQQPTPAPAQPPDVRPVKDRSGKQDKTCIWVKYRQHKISALIDTGSDVSIAGEDVARKMGWTIHKHGIKEVCVANNEVMPVRGAAYVTLAVAGRGIES